MIAKKICATFTMMLCFANCRTTTQPSDGSDSGLTEITINLPAKVKLPPELASKKLAYCFQLDEVKAGASSESKVGPQSTGNCEQVPGGKTLTGEYTDKVSINEKLQKNKSFRLAMYIGVKKEGIQQQQQQQGSQQQQQGGQIQQDSAAQFSEVFYAGEKSVLPADMKDKRKLDVIIDLKKVAAIQGPDVIGTESSEIDVSVQVRLPEEAQQQQSTIK